MTMNDVSRFQLLCAIICAVSVARVGTAQEALGALTLSGRIVRARDGAPIAGVDVWLISNQERVATDSSGSFRFAGLVAGPQLLQIRHLGYEVRRDTVTVSAGADSVFRFVLREQSAQLDTVRTVAGQQKYLSPMLRDFEERRHSGSGGHFIPDSTFRGNEHSTLGNLLQSRMPGMMFQYFNERRLAVSTRKACSGAVFLHGCSSKPDCFVAIYIDGQLFFNAKLASKMPPSAWPDMDQTFSVTTLTGAEYYASSAMAPSGMQVDDDGCGSLWLWTREK